MRTITLDNKKDVIYNNRVWSVQDRLTYIYGSIFNGSNEDGASHQVEMRPSRPFGQRTKEGLSCYFLEVI